MKFIKEKNIIILSLITFIFILISLFVFYNVSNYHCVKYRESLNRTISNFIIRINEKYPDITDQEIINILNVDNKSNSNILYRYGYTNELFYIKNIESDVRKNTIINLVMIFSFELIIFIIGLIYTIRRNKKLREINKYIIAINNKDYSLNIEDNNENELSRLKNELYKITISLKEAAETSEKEKQNLSNSITDISHQLKTPLTSIRIMLDNICENPDMDTKIRQEFIEDISRQIEWINSLVIALLKLSKFDAGVIVLNRREIYVDNLISDAIKKLSILLEVKDVTVDINIPKESKFKGDYTWELEAITNILKNAIEYTKEHSTIHIKAEDNSLFTKIIIRDEGEGISKEDMKHIFERFYKSENSSENSMGIGLSLAKAIIEKDGGYIGVDSQTGNGASFKIKYTK